MLYYYCVHLLLTYFFSFQELYESSLQLQMLAHDLMAGDAICHRIAEVHLILLHLMASALLPELHSSKALSSFCKMLNTSKYRKIVVSECVHVCLCMCMFICHISVHCSKKVVTAFQDLALSNIGIHGA